MTTPDLSEGRRLRWREIMGLTPVPERARQTWVALRGEADVPPSRFGVSSLAMLRPRMALPLWRGRFVIPRRAIVTNLFNHRQTPFEDGWSVRRTQVEDFRGRAMTYDSHNGTDLALPVGSTVVAPAPAQVVKVAAEFNRGGLKIYLDHGRGLMTTYAHLARALVREGQVVTRGAPIALSGYSGLDALVTFPLGVPHVHMNVWLNGEPVDPFARPGEPSLWRAGPEPVPAPRGAADEAFEPSRYDDAGLAAAIEACRTPAVRDRLRAIGSIALRAGHVVAEMNYYPTRFADRPMVYAAPHAREARLDLPLRAARFDGICFADGP